MSEYFVDSISKLLQDTSVQSYFLNHSKSPYDFMKLYIEVDKIIGTTLLSSNHVGNVVNVVNDKLDEIKNTLQNHSTQSNTILHNIHNDLMNSQTNVVNVIQSKFDTISNNFHNITNTDIRSMFVELQQQLQLNNGQDSQNLRNVIENFKDKIENINLQKLNDFDRKSLDILSAMQNNLLQTLDTHSISHKINSIENNLVNLNEHFSSNSSKKGQLAENVLINVLTETFPDTEVIDTSNTPNSGDIQLLKDNKPSILIDSKHFASKTVPKRDLDKFYSDIQQNNCSGILCNAFGGIANKQHFEIDLVDKNVLIFIHSHKFDPTTFQLAVNIIYNVSDQLKDKQHDSVFIDQRLYQNLKIEYNYYLQSLRHHLEIIKTNVNSLSQLSFNLLDNFFKRKATNIELKDFSCHVCGGGFSTLKSLKTHLRKIHGNILPPPNSTPPVVPTNNAKRGRPKITPTTPSEPIQPTTEETLEQLDDSHDSDDHTDS